VEEIRVSEGEPGDTVKAAVCLATINDFRLGVTSSDVYYGRKGATRAYEGCLSDTVTNDVFIRVFVNTVRENPSLMSLYWAFAFRQIFPAQYPCPK
jgi:hypothetical protein